MFTSTFTKSCYDLSWLKKQRQARRSAWRYFAFLVLLLTLVSVVPIWVVLPGLLRGLKAEVQGRVPAFSATIRDGRLTIEGVPQPFVTTTGSGLVVLVDTRTQSSSTLQGMLSPGQSGLLVSRDKLEWFDARASRGRTQYWQGTPDTSFTKADLTKWTEDLARPRWIVLAGGLLFLGWFIGLFLSKLFQLLLVSLLVGLVAGLSRRSWTTAPDAAQEKSAAMPGGSPVRWGELFTIGLYAVTLPSLIALLFSWFSGAGNMVHFLALLAFMLAMVFTKDQTLEAEAAGSSHGGAQNPPAEPPKTT